MSQSKSHHQQRHSRTTILLLVGFYSISIVAASDSLSITSQTSPETSSKEGSLLRFLLKPATNSASQHSNTNNNADNQERGQLYLYHKDNDSDNNDRLRFRRADVNIPSEGRSSKVIATNWGTYEEQTPVVVQSETRTIDSGAATVDESPTFSDVYQSREHDESSSEFSGPGSISYDDYESGRFEGRQFYPSRGAGYDSSEQEDGYYRQKYYATTAKPLNERQPLSGEDVEKEPPANRPHYPNRGGQQRPHYRQPQRKEEEESTGSNLMGFIQKAKTFYDIFRAMNSAWKTVEDHYRKTGEGIFPDEIQKSNQSQRIALHRPNPNQSSNIDKNQTNTRRPKTTKAPITPAEEEEEQQDTTQDNNDENRSRRASLDDENVSAEDHQTTHDIQSSESDLESPESELPSSSSTDATAVAEGRYIKGDPLKGYYDFVITEGSYKFWAAFQVGTALLIIYSTFAAIYYSKVNPLVSDYDYIDYLGGGRSLSDDSDFVDTDAPTTGSGGATAAADGSKIVPPGGASSRSRQQYGQSSAGWFGWVPHAGHTLRFILESIDKVYNDE